jgi:sugar phosphate isomerase/epimerase
MDFGISTHLFHAERLAVPHLETVAAHGFTAVEVFATRSHFDYHDVTQARALKQWCSDTGLRLHSLHAPIAEFLHGTTWGPGLSTAVGNAAARQRTLEECRRALDVAATAPYRYLVVHLGVPEASATPPTGDNQRDAVRHSLDVLRRAAEDSGVMVALEVIPNKLSTPPQLVRTIEDDDLHDVGICLDVGHAQLLGDVVDAIERTAGYLVTTHLHDNGGTSDDHLVPFEGVIDWPATLMAFQKVGYGGTLLFELAAGDRGAADTLARAVRARRRMDEILGDALEFSP